MMTEKYRRTQIYPVSHPKKREILISGAAVIVRVVDDLSDGHPYLMQRLEIGNKNANKL